MANLQTVIAGLRAGLHYRRELPTGGYEYLSPSIGNFWVSHHVAGTAAGGCGGASSWSIDEFERLTFDFKKDRWKEEWKDGWELCDPPQRRYEPPVSLFTEGDRKRLVPDLYVDDWDD